jgi:hypothetical protein
MDRLARSGLIKIRGLFLDPSLNPLFPPLLNRLANAWRAHKTPDDIDKPIRQIEERNHRQEIRERATGCNLDDEKHIGRDDHCGIEGSHIVSHLVLEPSAQKPLAHQPDKAGDQEYGRQNQVDSLRDLRLAEHDIHIIRDSNLDKHQQTDPSNRRDIHGAHDRAEPLGHIISWR